MTDTARSVAAVKNLLADNTTGNISPQDMRDVVESVVNPVIGGGFMGPGYSPDFAFAGINNSGQSGVPSGQLWEVAPVTATHDPAGLLQTGSYTAEIVEIGTWGPGQWFRLPVGIWMLQTVVTWNDLSLGTYRGLFHHAIDDRGGVEGQTDPFLYTPGNVGYLAAGFTLWQVKKEALLGSHSATAIMPITEQMVGASDGKSNAGDGWAVSLGSVGHDAGQEVTIGQTFVYAMRIGGVAG